MRRPSLGLLIPALALFCLAGEGRAELLASFEETAQGSDTGHAYFDYGDVDLVIGDDLVRLFDAAGLAPDDAPVLFEATAASDPDFATATALFTNGEPDEFVIELTGASGGGLGIGTNDCALFHGDYDCLLGVDLQGGAIDRFTLEVRELSLAPISPVGTEIVFAVTLQVFGAPEAEGALAGMSAIAALWTVLRARRDP
jgi:hypothetical protein